MLLPAVIYIFALVGIPLVLAVLYSLSDVTVAIRASTGSDSRTSGPSGTTPTFQKALRHSIVFTLVSQAIVIVLANILALVLADRISPASGWSGSWSCCRGPLRWRWRYRLALDARQRLQPDRRYPARARPARPRHPLGSPPEHALAGPRGAGPGRGDRRPRLANPAVRGRDPAGRRDSRSRRTSPRRRRSTGPVSGGKLFYIRLAVAAADLAGRRAVRHRLHLHRHHRRLRDDRRRPGQWHPGPAQLGLLQGDRRRRSGPGRRDRPLPLPGARRRVAILDA